MLGSLIKTPWEMNDRWRAASFVLGFLLTAAAAGEVRELLLTPRAEDWSSLARIEVELYGGLWLIAGAAPQWAWLAALVAFAGIGVADLVQAWRGAPPRAIWGSIATGRGWVLAADLAIVLLLIRARPVAGKPARGLVHPGWIAAPIVAALVIGAAIDASGIGQYPILARARSAGRSGGSGLDYLVYLPPGYHYSLARWPVILTLHGGGAVGNDVERVRTEGLPPILEKTGPIPFVVIAPQTPRGSWGAEDFFDVLDEASANYRIDPARVYLTGYSMGGHQTWGLAAAHPDRFAAIAPICGLGDPAWAAKLAGIPIWAFHGDQDQAVPIGESQRMVDAILKAGGDARLTVYPGVGHDSWTRTYQGKELYQWFLSHRR